MINSDFDFWNDDIQNDLSPDAIRQTITYSRAWTVETIHQQIRQGNIELNPNFQRRNAWNDEKRSRLIESLVLNIPVPEVILAERAPNSKDFLVLDGKQRLQAIIGFLEPGKQYWDTPKCRGLKVEKELNNKRWDDIKTNENLSSLERRLMNADVRCTIISNVQDDDVLYDIFFRLNSGSVPLSSQELRHSIYHGQYSDYISEQTSKQNALWNVLRLEQPDKRLRDAELFHRLILFFVFPDHYNGNLKRFLDQGMGRLNNEWGSLHQIVEKASSDIEDAYQALSSLLAPNYIGRKFVDGKWESRFNKALFEAQMFFSRSLASQAIDASKAASFKSNLEQLMTTDGTFMDSIESTTKTVERYDIRFEGIKKVFEQTFGKKVLPNPYKDRRT